MAHPRKELRQAVVALLVAADTDAGERVHTERVDPLKKTGLPAIAVYTLSEEVDQGASEVTSPRELTRIANLEIAGFVGGIDEASVADAMDDLAEQIEAAMDADPAIGGKAADSILLNTVAELQEGGRTDPLAGIIVLTYQVTYYTSPAAPANLDDLLRVDAQHELVGGVADTVPAEDLFDVRSP